MSLRSDLKVLYHLALKPIRGADHAQRMEDFYSGQADEYDDFRKRLLKGRELVYETLGQQTPGGVWVDMGGGTGANLEFIGPAISKFSKIYVVDLAASLLEVVNKRCQKNGWTNVEAVVGDATTWQLPDGQAADVVTFSYSLTMIPDWFAAIENALRLLKPTGKMGVIDFYVSRKYPESELRKHGWSTRAFWPVWFANDNVFLSPDHVPFLKRHFNVQMINEATNRLPYLPFSTVPYYQFIGEPKGKQS
jgi:S-adenosylmethionine-diacylgycerolhomoserine-N-methlytransferase